MGWICSQIGAREHYAVARALSQAGQLAGLYTDFWACPGTRALARISGIGPIRSLASRFHPELSHAPVLSWNLRSLAWEVERLRGQRSEDRGQSRGGEITGQRTTHHGPRSTNRYFGYINVGRRFAVRVRDALRRRPDLGSDSICFAYDTGALEAFEYLRERGVRCVLDQMDPNRVEFDLVREEEKRWPAWALNPIAVPDEYCQRREREWGLADVVVVNSEFCRQALLKQGVPEEKLVVVPLCYELPNPITPLLHHSTTPVRSPLRVLWLGQVILRKGIQYLIEAARLLQGENVRFEVVGPIGISGQAVKSAPDNMTFHGRVTRDQAATWYERADVFVLPTLSDGFAITQLEAMAHGLPVIATPNCGAVVRDGMDGLLVPPRDPVALAKAVARFATDHAFLAECSRTARARVRDFSLAALGDNLLRLGTQTSTLNYQPSTSLSRGPEVSGPVVS